MKRRWFLSFLGMSFAVVQLKMLTVGDSSNIPQDVTRVCLCLKAPF